MSIIYPNFNRLNNIQQRHYKTNTSFVHTDKGGFDPMTGSRFFRVLWPFLVVILLASCSTTESLGPQSMQGALAGEPLGDYRLRSGDELEVKFFNHPDLNERLLVGPDGKIGLPLVDEILVAGLTTSQLDELLTREYAKYLANVSLSVMVREYSGLRAFVGGEVAAPGFVSLKGNMSVLQAILVRQGFIRSSKPENVILLRKGPGNRPVAMVVDLGPVISGEQIENDVYLMPSDIVYVPKTSIAKAGEFVDLYMRKVLMFDSVIRGAGHALGFYFVRENVYGYEEEDYR